MYNWNTDTKKWNKKSSSYQIWRLEQLINYGLNGEKLDIKQLKKYWTELTLDKHRKRFIKLLL